MSKEEFNTYVSRVQMFNGWAMFGMIFGGFFGALAIIFGFAVMSDAGDTAKRLLMFSIYAAVAGLFINLLFNFLAAILHTQLAILERLNEAEKRQDSHQNSH